MQKNSVGNGRRSVALGIAGVLGTTLVSAALSNVSAQAVAGGSAVPVDSYDFIAKIEIEGHSGCTGSLIDPQWLITSASCFAGLPPEAPTTRATVGRPDSRQQTGAVIDVAEVVTHPDRDVALAKLVTPTTGVTPISLSATPPAQGETLQVAGYGRTADTWVPTHLQHASFSVDAITPETLAILGTDVSTCKGDAGGPALRQRADDSYELVAINSTSWQSGCLASTETRQGATESRTDNIVDWVRNYAPSLSIACKPTANIFAVRADGGLWLYEHASPGMGEPEWASEDGVGIGRDWSKIRPFAGKDGVVYAAHENGTLYRYRWNGTGWDRPGGNWAEQIGTGWGSYTTSAYRNRITADSNGHIFTMGSDNHLHWRSYDPIAKTWAHRVAATNWGEKYNLIVAAGDGVIYARTPDGKMFRNHYDAATNTWIQYEEPNGWGWQGFKWLASAGADTLYGPVNNTQGDLLWYRYIPRSDSWIARKVVNTGWADHRVATIAPDSCTLR